MSTKSKNRPLSASRQRRQQQRSRRHSLNANPSSMETEYHINGTSIEPNTFYSEIDFRSPKEIIESLETEMNERKDDSTFEEQLNSLVLLQLYTYLEYGEYSIENIRAYFNLSKFYFGQKNMIRQATTHIQTARQILEKMNIQPNKDHLIENLLGFDLYLLSLQCSLNTKDSSTKRDLRTKTKQIEKKKSIEDDLKIIEEYFENLKQLMSMEDYEKKNLELLLIKFDLIVTNIDEFNSNISEIIEEIINIFHKYPLETLTKRKIDIFLRYGFYLIHFDDRIQEGLDYYKQIVQLAEKDEEDEPSDAHKYQLANGFFQWAKARVRINRVNDNTEKKFQRAIDLHRQVNDENDKIVLKMIDELANFYTKTKKYQDALNILCESLSEKKRLFGDFSEEVIETESRIGAIYLCECEYLNAAEHLKECLTLQEFVYGSQSPKTRQTRDALELLKKDPTVFRTFFSRTQDAIRQDRPAFRLSNKISYDKEDSQLLTTKPPISSRN